MRVIRKAVCAAMLACALTHARVAAAQPPTSRPPDLLMSEGHALFDAGRYKEAAASFERALQLGVKKPHEAAREVARSYARLGNRKQALRWEEIAVQLVQADGRAGNAARALPSLTPASPSWRAQLTQRRQSSDERDREEHRPGSAAREEARRSV